MSKAGPSLEERQRRVIEAWVQNPNKTYPEIAAIGGVSDITFYRYRKDEKFMEDYHKACNQRFKGLEAQALSSLKQQMDEGNFQAIKYILDYLGYKPTDKVEANVSGKQDIVIEIN